MFRSVTLAALLAYASAQSISSACTNALTGIATNPDAAACLSPGSLVPIIAGGANASIVSPINNWLTSLCSAPACSNDTIAAVVQNITSGCSNELSGLGLTSSMVPSITGIIEQYYPTARQVVCLKDGNTNCVTQTLTNIQNVVGPLTLNNIVQIASNATTTTLPSNVTCTNCVKAAYNIINSAIPSLTSDSAPAVQSECGASFTDGTTPSGIAESASTSSTTANQAKAAALGSVSMMSHGALASVGASGLILVFSLFTFLA
ncbi:hypothetical protein CPB84DRAFT_1781457 [Gymnopilus junonius]|uniref:Secreted protein n=1 Tax=Gymnopilus junonius TaxID=109634 RepID=A0A9P5NM16_GYMJU|nr:hypothetical protein CPB84DRAFT_1781457 [Gymnopilus junonius]